MGEVIDGGVNVFVGRLHLYNYKGRFTVMISISGDSPCVDHLLP